MTPRDTPVEQCRNLAWFIELRNKDFERLAKSSGYTDEQFRNLKDPLKLFGPALTGE